MNMGFLTDFIGKHTRHATPVVIAGMVFVGTAWLNSYDAEMDRLSENPNPKPYDYRKPWVRSAIAAFVAWGALMNQAVGERRQKIVSDTDWVRRQASTRITPGTEEPPK